MRFLRDNAPTVLHACAAASSIVELVRALPPDLIAVPPKRERKPAAARASQGGPAATAKPRPWLKPKSAAAAAAAASRARAKLASAQAAAAAAAGRRK